MCAGCLGEWDNVSCWQRAAVGEVMTLPCPSPILRLFGKNGESSSWRLSVSAFKIMNKCVYIYIYMITCDFLSQVTWVGTARRPAGPPSTPPWTRPAGPPTRTSPTRWVLWGGGGGGPVPLWSLRGKLKDTREKVTGSCLRCTQSPSWGHQITRWGHVD